MCNSVLRYNWFETNLASFMGKYPLPAYYDGEDLLAFVRQYKGKYMSDFTVKEICANFTDNPKTMEQRIRRAAAIGMINIANLGIEDYMNETFIEYSNGLYNFEQIKQEMDYIRKKSKKRGAVNIKKFIDNMLYYAKE